VLSHTLQAWAWWPSDAQASDSPEFLQEDALSTETVARVQAREQQVQRVRELWVQSYPWTGATAQPAGEGESPAHKSKTGAWEVLAGLSRTTLAAPLQDSGAPEPPARLVDIGFFTWRAPSQATVQDLHAAVQALAKACATVGEHAQPLVLSSACVHQQYLGQVSQVLNLSGDLSGALTQQGQQPLTR